MVILHNNIFYVASGARVWNGPFLNSCMPPGSTTTVYSSVDSNDYYNESPQNSSANFNYGTNAKYEDPQFSSIVPGSIDLEAMDPTITNNTSPAWSAFATDPQGADAFSGITEGPADSPTDVLYDTEADNASDVLANLDPTTDGTGYLPDSFPMLSASQIANCDATCWANYQAQYPPDPNSETYDSSGWAYPPNIRKCPEPNSSDNFGSGWCGYSFAQKYPLGYTDGSKGGWPSGDGPGSSAFYSDLCGPGSAAFVMHTLRPDLVDDWNQGITGTQRKDKSAG
jgi:hypothetical protein